MRDITLRLSAHISKSCYKWFCVSLTYNTLSLKHVLTSNQNHIENAKIARSSYVGLNFKDLKLGYNVDSTNALKQAKISYQYSF